MIDKDTALLLAVSGFFTSIGAAFTEIWIKPGLKRLKKKHDKINKRLRGGSHGLGL
jgi:hypothetical protein